MRIFQSLEPTTRRNLTILFVAGLLFWSSMAALLPTLSLYVKYVGGSNHQVGIVMGAFAIGLLVFRPLLGQLADRRGRKGVLLIGLMAAAIAPLGYLMTQSIPLLIGVRIFHGVSIAAFTTAYSALMVDLSPEAHRGEVIGYMSLVNPIGVAVGPAIGGFLQEWAGYTPLFLASTGLGVAGLVCGWCVSIPRHVTRSSPDRPELQQSSWRLLGSPRLRIPALVLLLIGLAFGTLSTFVPLFIQETGVGLNAGLFYTGAAIASFSVRLLTGRASDRYGRGRFITLGLVFYTSAMVMLWTANSALAFLLAAVLEGSGSGIFLPMMVALLADRSRMEERGRVFSLSMAGFDLGIAIAGPTLGYFAEQIGYRGLFGLAATVAFLALVSFVSRCCKDLFHSLQFALGNGPDLHALTHRTEGS